MAPLTDPYGPDTGTMLCTAHGQRATITATGGTLTAPVVLDLVAASIGWDETRAPRVSARVTARVPAGQATLDALDPRTGVRLLVDAGYVRPGGAPDLATIADLGLRSRSVSRPDNTITLAAASDEALAVDASPHQGLTLTAASQRAAIQTLVNQCFPTARTFVASGPVGVPLTYTDPITDRWGAVEDISDALDLDVYDAGLRTWVIEPRPTLASVAAAILAVGPAGTIAGSETTLDRDQWANAVVLHHSWTDAGGVQRNVYGYASTTAGTFAVTGPAGRRAYTQDRTTPTTQAQANAAARVVLARFLSRCRSFRLRAVAAYWLRPGMTVTVALPTGDQERHLVSAVELDLLAGRMDVTTRLPDLLSTTTAGA